MTGFFQILILLNLKVKAEGDNTQLMNNLKINYNLELPNWIDKDRCWDDKQQYFNRCKNCNQQFTGHKHRRICKICVAISNL